jgi:predicted RNA binding protein YcfA (HicA-like mRNA interferase family)
MSRLASVSQSDLIRRLRRLGFMGPFSGGRHLFMTRDNVRLILPNPHRGDVSPDLLIRILKQAGLSREEWLGC